MSYLHLSLAERYYIEIELKMEVSINKIAKARDVHKALFLAKYAAMQGNEATDISRPIA